MAVRSDAGVGVLATLTMDAGFVAASLLGGDAFTSERAGLEPVGRWAALLARGRLRFDDLQTEPPVTGEAAIGLAVHYATGIALTRLYLETLRRTGRRPSVAGAAAYGAGGLRVMALAFRTVAEPHAALSAWKAKYIVLSFWLLHRTPIFGMPSA